MAYRPAQVYTGSGWDDIGDKRIGAQNGDIPQASVANLTTDLAAKIDGPNGAWTAGTVTLGGAGWAIGNGTITCAYVKQGRAVTFATKIVFGSTSTYGTSWLQVTVPVAAAVSWPMVGTLQCTDSSTGLHYFGGITGLIYPQAIKSGTNGQGDGLLSTFPFTWASGDVIYLTGTYEAAS